MELIEGVPVISCPPSVLIAAILAALMLAVFLAWFPVHVYHKGMSRSNPTPSSIERIINPPPALVETPAYTPPITPCPYCKNGPKWSLSPDKSKWICDLCSKQIVGPEPRVRS